MTDKEYNKFSISDRTMMLRKDAKPAKRIDLFIFRPYVFGDALAADPMEPVTSGDIIALQPKVFAILAEGHKGCVGFQILRVYLFTLEKRLAAGLFSQIIQITRDLGLTVNDYRLARMFGEIQPHLVIVIA